MTQLFQVYKCEVCGNMVEVVHASGGTLSCCGQNMTLLEEKTADKTTEKHVPVIEKISENQVKIIVGSTLHPMEEKHYIEWIEALSGNTVLRHYLKPGEKPEATFNISASGLSAREFCNIHGLWKS